MIGILFIYWIWKSFTNLALEYDKNKWTYFFIGLGSYYGGTIFAGFFGGLAMGLIKGFDVAANEDFENPGWSILFVLIGGLACYGAYKFLENKVQKERELNKIDGIDDIGVVEEN
ncbi:hypothetical protein C8C83_2363 [Flavobacterium sp. 90]|uniref:hypothetical protein n=1 Tax=unclassified Flavobacterium TaxID=196869 RepID=UPI000EB07932|nr:MULTISPECIES: hypothetical protein [unclassified Flavobacterium]RKR10684.1 hypothetical protein C8C82_2668 [Flavobacterium sp. 81]TCK54467.1 hypothetical protein C8C83_2363 [Flavobacterium sp. 90]